MSAIGPALPAAVTLVGLSALLAAKWFDFRPGIWVAKPLAALGFVALALSVGALETPYGVMIFVGLLLSLGGDVLLIPDKQPAAFKAGLASFLLGHVAYTLAFVTQELDLQALGVATVAAAGTAWAVLRWLTPHVKADMLIPVRAYIAVISCMLVSAAGCASALDRPDIFVGALLFYLSDFAVARDRFVSPGFWNGAWGLPFYFLAQLILAFGSGSGR